MRLKILSVGSSPERLVVAYRVEATRDAYVACGGESCGLAGIQPVRIRFADGTLRVASALAPPEEGVLYVAPPRVAFKPMRPGSWLQGTITVPVPVTVIDMTAVPHVRPIALSQIDHVALELGVLLCDDHSLLARLSDGLLKLRHDFVIECHGRAGTAMSFQIIATATAPLR